MSAEQKKTGGRIKRNLPSMPQGSDDADEIETVEADEDAAEGNADDAEDELVEVEQDDDDNDDEVEDDDEADIGDEDVDGAEEDVEPVDGEEEEADIGEVEEGEVEEEPESVVDTDPDAVTPGQDFADSRFARPNEGRGTFVPEWVMRICKNGNEMLVLSQLAFWFKQAKNWSIQARKLLEPASDYYWFAKSYHDLGSRVGLKPWQVRYAIDRLTAAGFVIKEDHLFQNIRTNFFRLDPHAIAQALSTQNEAT